MLWPLRRRPKITAPPRGPAIQHTEQEAARRRILDQARRRRAEHLYDGPTR